MAKKTFARADALDEFGGEPALRLGEIQIGDVDQFLRLLDERLGDGRMRVAEAAHGNAAAEVEIAFAGDIKNITARAVAQDEFKASVAGHDVFREQLADGFEWFRTSGGGDGTISFIYDFRFAIYERLFRNRASIVNRKS